LVTDSHSILARGRNHFSQLFNGHGVSDVRQIEIHTAVILVSEPRAFEFGMIIKKLNRHKSPRTDQIQAELFKAGSRTLNSEIYKVIHSIWNKEKFPEELRSQSLYLSIKRVIKQIVVIIEAYYFCQIRSKIFPTSCCQG
jgi:hypothetical protein